MKQDQKHLFQQIPSVDDLIQEFDRTPPPIPRNLLLRLIRESLKEVRQAILDGELITGIRTHTINLVNSKASSAKSTVRKVINGTGIVLHTGLGRAPQGNEIWSEVLPKVTGYTNIELNLSDGKRGERYHHTSDVLNTLTGAEASLAVNNNAAAVLLMLNSLAENRDVIISRGQQVEIGGSFRIPDVIRKSGCRMVEVGTTNKTHRKDYEQALNASTGAVLVAHPSNYRISGFTQSVPISALSELCRGAGIPLIVDLGSGAIPDLPGFQLPDEPQVHKFFDDGADVVSFSGDKLLGGPQAGIICGSAEMIRKIHKNALYRALRLDKTMIALLDAAIRTFYSARRFSEKNLALTLLTRSQARLRTLRNSILDQL